VTILSNDPIGGDGAIPKAALVLGWAGVVPFAAGGLAVMTGTGPIRDGVWVLVPLLAYGAVILSFLGGVRWGLALRVRPEEAQARALALSVLPSLVGWVGLCLYAHPGVAVMVLIAGHVVQGAYDVAAAREGLAPAWYGRLRIQLTAAAALALTFAWIGLLVRG